MNSKVTISIFENAFRPVRGLLLPAACLALLLAGCATSPSPATDELALGSPVADLQLQPPVRRAWLPNIDNWRAVDREHIVLWHSPRKAYLVHIRPRLLASDRMDFTLGVRQFNGYLTPFDYVVTEDGMRHQITDIWELTPEQTDQLTGRKREG